MRQVMIYSALSLAMTATALLGAPANGSGPGPIAASLTGSGDLGGKEIAREELFHYDAGSAARMLFSKEGLAFMIGDLNGDGIEDEPGNIDALHVAAPGTGQPFTGLFLSFSTNCCSVQDGDVILFGDTGGITVHLPESYFIAVTGATDGNVDVDAFTEAPSGEIYFSFAENENSALLPGGQPGVIEDGDIIRVDIGGAAEILYTESDVSSMVSNALGKSYSAGDVLGLSFDAAAKALLFTVQSPTSDDATIFSDQNGGTVCTGYDEASLGFSNGVEIDGFSLLPVLDDLPSLEIEPRYPAQGDTITITLSGGPPLDIFCLLISGAKTQTLQPPYLGGFGAILLDMTHPYFLAGLMGIRVSAAVAILQVSEHSKPPCPCMPARWTFTYRPWYRRQKSSPIRWRSR